MKKMPGSDSTKPHSFQMTRRRMLKYSASMAAMAMASTFMPPNVRRALAQEPARRASLKDIQHVVLLMQENRSFDHYFGTLAGVRGFDDPNALRLPSGKSVFYQPDPENPDGYLLPFHLNTRQTSAQKIPSTDHGWRTQHEAWNGGKMDNWVPAHRKADGPNGPYTMGYYRRADIPFQFALAEAFTICDAYHCSILGPTWPNRMYWMTGTIDPAGANGGPVIANKIPPQGFSWTTYAERLEKAGVSWKCYQQPDNYGTNVLEYFNQFKNAAPDSPLHLKGMVRGPAGQFEYDAMNDKLPAVSWLFPPSYQCEHPDYMPADGAAFVASKIDAIAANPEVWAKTVFILNYDENDGIFDHVAPPVPPPGTELEFVKDVKDLPIGAGFRVPCIIVSPWTTGGWVCSQPFDHTSILQFLEKFTGVREDNISPWRRQTFGDLTSAFRFDDDKASQPTLPDTGGILEAAIYETTHLPKPILPGSNQTMPAQEKGERKRVS
jgi:phospholipase C